MDLNWPIIALLIGWSGNELSHHLRAQQGHRAELCRAITALLELRHILRGTEEVITLVAQKANADRKNVAAAIRPLILQQYLSATMLQNYAKAVDAIAGLDPLLAYDLTGRHRLPEVLSIMQNMVASVPNAAIEVAPVLAKFVSNMADFVVNRGIKSIENCITQIAWRASKRLWWQCRCRIRRNAPNLQPGSSEAQFISDQFDEFVKMAAAAEAARRSQADSQLGPKITES